MIPDVLPQLLLLSGIAIVVALPVTGVRAKPMRWSIVAGAIVLTPLGAGLLLFQHKMKNGQGANLALAELLPDRRLDGGYVTSQSCRECHEHQFATWHHSFHRTMTQAVSPETVEAPFDNVVLELQRQEYRLSRRGDEFWVNMPDPKWYLDRESADEARKSGLPAEPARVERRIVMSTGSHHMQLYWVVDPESREILSVPFIYLFSEQRWVPRADVFLAEEDYHGDNVPIRVWNEGCVNCHAVAGQPRLRQDEGRHDTRVAELGIACEACHGPGEEHVRTQKLARHPSDVADGDAAPPDAPSLGTHQPKLAASSTQPDPTIINPASCDPKTSAQICGRCHAVNHIRDEAEWNTGAGDTFRPGQDLEAVRVAVRDPRRVAHEFGRDADGIELPAIFPHFFWPDGLARSSGREYNALLESPCFRRGEMSCLSCHSLHQSDPDDQLAAGMRGNQACYQCHAEYEAKLTEHTHHAADSEGSRCYNCHMPHTSYGLMKGIRAHTVTNPSVEESTRHGRPNACNLCHLDQTLEWTGEHLTSWYGQPRPELDEEQQDISAALLWLLRGDAGQRALTAWHFGWEPARQASGTEWMPPFLAELLVDPYAAVRYITYHSLLKSHGYEDFSYDYIGSLRARAAGRREVLSRWHGIPPEGNEKRSGQLLMDAQGQRQEEAIRRLIHRRDDRPVEIWE